MATTETGTTSVPAPGGPPASGLFLRKASGLVKGWSAADVFFFAFVMVSPVVGFYGMSFAPFIPGGSLIWAMVIGTLFMGFGAIVYAGLISVMPRAGGDYLFQTRVLTGGIGFVLAATGFWFIMAQWAPIYGNVAVLVLFAPLAATVGLDGVVTWFSTDTGVLVAALVMIAFATFVVAVGLKSWAKIQRVMFALGFLGILIVALLLLFNDKESFATAFNEESADMFGTTGDAYAKTEAVGTYGAVGLSFPFKETLQLIPFVLFWNLWYVWGASLHGEVRGASDFKRTTWSMALGLLSAFILMILLLALVAKTMGWEWYNAANNAYWGGGTEAAPLPIFPYPVMLATWLVDSVVFQFVVIAIAGLTFLGWASSLFIASTRIIFAAAFDRVLPAWAARVSDRRGVPVGALALMVVPSIGFSILYAYSDTFRTYLFDATVVLVVTFLGTAVAAGLLPWRAKRAYESSPAARYKVAGIPLVTIAAVVYGGMLVFALILWLSDEIYGVNQRDSLIYMGALYVIAIGIFIAAKVVRSRQGVELSRSYKEIPVD